MDKIFCRVHLFRVTRSWTASVQMKSSMTFTRGNRCIGRETDTFKSREVKRLKDGALALRPLTNYSPSETRLSGLIRTSAKRGIAGSIPTENGVQRHK